MRITGAVAILLAMTIGPLIAQQDVKKPVPKDSVRVTVSGCAKGYAFTAGPTIAEEVARYSMPEGTHMRMNGPKKLIAEIDAYKGSMVQITGLVRKDQYKPGGVSLGGGVQITSAPTPTPTDSARAPNPVANTTVQIDVEGWSPGTGRCPE